MVLTHLDQLNIIGRYIVKKVIEKILKYDFMAGIVCLHNDLLYWFDVKTKN